MRSTIPNLALLALLLPGCAYTHIERDADGSFSYTSTRDSAIEGLRVTRSAEGSLDLAISGATGSASPVVAAQVEVLRAAIEASFSAGRRAALGAR